jgi:hypothetical protein
MHQVILDKDFAELSEYKEMEKLSVNRLLASQLR